MTDSSGKIAQWRLRLSEFDFIIVHRAGSKQQAADALSRLDTNGNDGSPPDEDLPVFTIRSQCDGEIRVSSNEDDPPLLYEKLNEGFTPFILEVFRLSRRQADDLENVLSIRENLKAEKNDRECCQATDAVGIPNSKFKIDEHGIFMQISQLDSAVQRYVPRNLCSRFLYLCHY